MWARDLSGIRFTGERTLVERLLWPWTTEPSAHTHTERNIELRDTPLRFAHMLWSPASLIHQSNNSVLTTNISRATENQRTRTHSRCHCRDSSAELLCIQEQNLLWKRPKEKRFISFSISLKLIIILIIAKSSLPYEPINLQIYVMWLVISEWKLFKGLVHPKIKILSLITHPHVVANP